MGSEQNDSTSFTQSAEPKLCANGCGFFGSPSNMGLCSKCYRNICAEEAQTAVAKAAVEKSLKPSCLFIAEPAVKAQQKESVAVKAEPLAVKAEPDADALKAEADADAVKPEAAVKPKAAVKAVVVVAEPSSAGGEAAVSEPSQPSRPARPNRCLCCNKKVGILGFKCRCGSTFCGDHRYPESHDCSFDFKEVGRGEIAKANPVIKADKLQRF